MEFLSAHDGPIIPDPEQPISDEALAQTQRAVDFFAGNADRIKYFEGRVHELGRSGLDTVVTLINVDDPFGGVLADMLMPDHDWQQYRDRGEAPLARGLAAKAGMVEFLEKTGFTKATTELRNTDDLRVVVVDAGVVLVMDVDFGHEPRR